MADRSERNQRIVEYLKSLADSREIWGFSLALIGEEKADMFYYGVAVSRQRYRTNRLYPFRADHKRGSGIRKARKSGGKFKDFCICPFGNVPHFLQNHGKRIFMCPHGSDERERGDLWGGS